MEKNPPTDMEISTSIKNKTEAENKEEPRIIRKAKEFLAKFEINDYELVIDEKNCEVKIIIKPPKEHLEELAKMDQALGTIWPTKFSHEKIFPFINEIRYSTSDLDYNLNKLDGKYRVIVFKDKNKMTKPGFNYKFYQKYQKRQKK